MKRIYILSILLACAFTASKSSANGELLKDTYGNILFFSQDEASGLSGFTGKKEITDVCQTRGKGHLPTIRELAEEAQSRGAKGILELSQVNPDQVPTGYYKISAINPDGNKDEFYYNPEGYILRSDLYVYRFWSSSIHLYSRNYAYSFHTGISYEYSVPQYPVLCFSGK